MRKLTILFALLLSAGLWATTQNVSYLYPVYNTEGVVTSGIKEWKTGNVTATVVESATEQVTWGTAGATTWLVVVTGSNITLSKGAICNGAVHLILADGATLTATADNDKAAIQVSGEGNSLTIYGQTAQSGQLIAIGGEHAAGIGGGYYGSGSNITINGGKVTATGNGQGSAAIGGGYSGSGSNITINGGTVIATAAGYWGAGIGGGLYCSGSNIVINGGEVTATGGSSAAGIGGGRLSSGTNISINGGTIIATGGENGAGIGGGSGDTGGSPLGGKCSDISIKGGIVVTSGGKYGAGIGGGYKGSGSNITITGGDITALGGGSQYFYFGAGIGSGYEGNASSNILVDTWCSVKADGTNPPTTVIVNDGTDLAEKLEGKKYATVKTPKRDLTATDFVISDNTATYDGTAKAATVALKSAIKGAGEITVTYKQNSTEVTNPTNAGTYDIYAAVTAGTNYNAFASAEIGTLTIGKANLTAEDFDVSDNIVTYDGGAKAATVAFKEGIIGAGEITVSYKRDEIEATPINAGTYDVCAAVTEGTNYNAFAATKVGELTILALIPYIDENGEEQTIGAFEITSTDKAVTWNAGWYVVTGSNVTLSKGAVCSGAVHLILADGATLTVTGEYGNPGIKVSGGGNSLTIYGQTAQTGQLIANGGLFAAGIGGGSRGNGSNITINGGVVTVTGGGSTVEGYGPAGIGGGDYGDGFNITINGGTVTSTGGPDGAGIGGGYDGIGFNITINGGVVTATGNNQSSGIGGGKGPDNSPTPVGTGRDITINGGVVTAIGGKYAAGIGGGNNGAGYNITITDGEVYATGGIVAAGIGSGARGSGHDITISGGKVTAIGGETYKDVPTGDAIGNSGNSATAASNILVATPLVVKADGNNPPTTVIAKDRTDATDIASALAGKRYATVGSMGTLTTEDFVVSNNEPVYDGTPKAATVTFKEGITGAGTITVTYKQGETGVAKPVNVGKYDIYAAVAEGDSYNAFAATQLGTLTIAKATLTADNFIFTAPADLTWNGNPKTATVTFDDQSAKLSGCGAVTVKYNGNTTAPIVAGEYTVSIDVTEGENFAATTTALTKDDWKFTITKATLTADAFEVSDNSAIYNGEAKAATVALKEGITGAGEITVSYKQDEIEATPINAGVYDIYAAVAEGDSYNAFAATQLGTLTINKATLTADNFIFTAPADLTWNGNAKKASVTFNDQSDKLTGCGNVTIKYNDSEQAPVAAGNYTVSIDVAEGTNFAATTTALTKDDWKFTITKATLTVADFVIGDDNFTYNGEAKAATVAFKEGITGAGEITVTYKQGDNTVTPTDAGEYDIYVAVTEGDSYNAFASAKVGKLTIAKDDLAADVFEVSNTTTTYDGEAKAATVAFKEGITGAGTITVTYKLDNEVVTPINANVYAIYAAVSEGANYNAFEAIKVGELIINQAIPTTDLFTVILPENLVYDGTPKTATVTFNDQGGKLTGIDFIVRYDYSQYAPVDVGNHIISINVKGPNYEYYLLEDEAWQFTIEPPVEEWKTVRGGLTVGKYGTFCWDHNLTAIDGAELYKVASKENDMIILEEVPVEETQAGAGYVIYVTAEALRVKNGENSVETPVGYTANNGLQGTFEIIEDGASGTQGNQLEGNYIIYNNEWRLCGEYCGLLAHSAYLVLDAIQPVALTPGRAMMRMPNPEAQTPTALDNLTEDGIRRADARKVVHRGNLYILRDSRIYNAQGQEIKNMYNPQH